MAEPYATPREVRSFSGVTHEMLDLPDEASLMSELVGWIAQAQEMVEGYVEVAWDEFYVGDDEDVISGPVPRGITNATMRIVGNMVAQARQRRQSSTMSLSEFREILIPDEVFTDSIRKDLDPYYKGGRKYRNITPAASSAIPFKMMVTNRHTVERVRQRKLLGGGV